MPTNAIRSILKYLCSFHFVHFYFIFCLNVTVTYENFNNILISKLSLSISNKSGIKADLSKENRRKLLEYIHNISLNVIQAFYSNL